MLVFVGSSSSDNSGGQKSTGRGRTSTSAFGAGRREGHDASEFYARFSPPELSDDETVSRPPQLIDELGIGRVFNASATDMSQLPDNSVALVVTSPPYFVGKEYELAVTGGSDDSGIPSTYIDFLEMLRDVFSECVRVLEPGGRIAVNVANLGRKPYRSLSADVVGILQDDLGLLLRGEVLWEKSEASSGSCAWGSFAKASNPVLRDMTERVVIASKGRFSRAISAPKREEAGLPHVSTITNDEFVEVTRDVWRMDPESASRIGHPAPFPVDLPRRLIDLYTYVGDLVLDPFAGSGTTLVAAARTGRVGVGYDLDPNYVALAEERIGTEVARIDGVAALAESLDDPDPELRAAAFEKLTHEDRLEHFWSLAVSESMKVADIATARLNEAGFGDVRSSVKHPGGALEADFEVTTADGNPWYVELGGSFTSARPGLQRADAVWRMLGRLSVLGAHHNAPPPIVLTPALPPPGSASDKALRAAGPAAVFDVIELHEPAGLARLAQYASSKGSPEPIPGFWSTDDLDS
ncbi:MAG: site-specific DNA-methyltransferase [Actinomycetia bacterium]|nr:site-specific DNA-methyltransferase [Actinomycetes bacterium]